MTKCTSKVVEFPSCKSRKVEAEFSGGAVTSDGGALLLRAADRALGLSRAVSKRLSDDRQEGKCTHSLVNMLRQRIYGIALGYEDLNDHDELRKDLGFQTSVESLTELASSPTLCRLESRASRDASRAIHEVLVETFLNSFKKAPKELILDFDATDDPTHGRQEGVFFHGYYDCYCFLPLYVFCGEHLLVSYLRPSNIDAARHTGAILRLLVRRIRAQFPKVKIIFRGDSGFCRMRVLNWCERENVQYVVGIAKNSRLLARGGRLIARAEKDFEKSQVKQRLFGEFLYAAKTWSRTRRVIAKAEHSSQGSNPRFIVTNMDLDPQHLYDKIYCARGDMENRIKEQQLGLFADRTSCHRWWANQFRLLLSSLAYVLISHIRRVALKGTELATAQVNTIRLKLFKIGGVIRKNTRRIRFLLASACPFQDLFRLAASRLTS